MKKILMVIGIIIFTFILIPFVEIRKDNKLVFIKYKEDFSYFEDNTCYHENVSYNKKRNISITNINIKKYFIFYLYKLEFKEGNLCDTEYLLEESYIKDFIDNAKITYNSHNIDIKPLIKGRKAIVSNTRYLDNNYETFINYKLNNKTEVMYVFYQDDLLILQVGSPDETTKFIAYK